MFIIKQPSEWNSIKKSELFVFFITIFITLSFLLYIAFERTYFNTATETDTVGGFIPEALNILTGQPLLLSYHPPLYPFTLSFVFLIMQNWLHAGIAISTLSSVVVLITIFYTFKLILGKVPAVWACIVTATSPLFLFYATQASSDLYFLALYSLAIWYAFYAFNSQSQLPWLICGFLIGMTILTRANGIILLLLILFPFTADYTLSSKIKTTAYCVAGLLLCCGIWVIYALITDSKLMPTETYQNVAMTYFATGDRISDEALQTLPENINGILDVLMHDPKVFIVTYVKDLYDLFKENLYAVLTFPFIHFAFVGMIMLAVLCWKNKNLSLYVLLTAAHVFLINLKAFDPRFYLFMIPFFGVGIGVLIHCVLQAFPATKIASTVGIAAIIGLISIALWTGQSFAISQNHKLVAEYDEVIPKVQSIINTNDVVISRKRVLGIHTNAISELYPNDESFEELRNNICTNFFKPESNMWLYYGSIEIAKRPQHKELLTATTSQPWLEVVAKGKENKWALYKVHCDKK